ncbi:MULTISPECIES: D-alanyl-D-alanine carboxypeptidase family protein [Rhodomicrobium]|uniref:D-alanyl-D-alanine carboxypeptidase family protein n=1 Tax=Rhodomicrobium TaxID=1068 RepID=UPI001FD92CAB|nr:MULTISPECIES: D-alanyl-D-alanine carboxypeptidase family protein [Rhodomicrobium]
MTPYRRLFLAALAGMFLSSSPASAQGGGPAMVIEPASGLVIYAEEADRPWHPASLTKLMTAYITFEALRDGKLSLEDKITCSEHALSQPPSKIGLPVGGQMTVDLALKALIVKSANDVAVMLAERIAGSEEAFVERMNQTAKRLGMSQTHFFNANGLPNDQQVTTARDMATLGRALLAEFPQHESLYSLPSFKVGKRTLRSHNSLLKVFEGADGMKTGFICASGYNVVASAKRGDRRILAVVLGAESSGARTARAAQLIQHGFDNYQWKTMFSTRLDQIALDASASEAPGDLRPIVCKPRPVRVRKKARVKAKPGQPAAKQPAAKPQQPKT